MRPLPNMKLYMAGGLFTSAEVEFNRVLAEQLKLRGYTVFLPQDFEANHPEVGFDPVAIFENDVGGVDGCDVVVANMDGADQDSGTCWEVGYGYAKGKQVLLYRTDIRAGREAINLMMEQCAHFTIVAKLVSVQGLAEAIDIALRSPVFTSVEPARYRHSDK